MRRIAMTSIVYIADDPLSTPRELCAVYPRTLINSLRHPTRLMSQPTGVR
jgi:hypothetical protein